MDYFFIRERFDVNLLDDVINYFKNDLDAICFCFEHSFDKKKMKIFRLKIFIKGPNMVNIKYIPTCNLADRLAIKNLA